MALTYKEAQLIKTTLPFLRDHGVSLSERVYATLIERHPELNNVLNPSHLKDGRLARALTTIILRFASSINNISDIIPRLERVCNRHCTQGVKPEHYDAVGNCIIEQFLLQMPRHLWSPETEKAWRKAYSHLSRMMMERERQIYKGFSTYNWLNWRKLRVDRKTLETDDLYSFYLVTTDGSCLPQFLPGQYVTLRFFHEDIGYYQSRLFSLSDSPFKDYYRITVRRDLGLQYYNGLPVENRKPGLVSNFMIDSLMPGMMVDVSHPSGEYTFDISVPSNAPIVLISAGVGAAALMSHLESLAKAQPNRHVTWIHGCRDGVPFGNRLSHLAKKCPNMNKVIFKTLIKHGDVLGETYDFNCRIDLTNLDLSSLLFTDVATAEYYICAPEELMHQLVEQLQFFGIPKQRMKCQLFHVGELLLDSMKICG